ncbi:expressed unknown protein [Seminavis robusta]|uniref:Uncharacterized protein n=1 Tax=Seminavis robusta TaxID=568900 RepID=A0A9N8H898_9STRA|nr:expressed unknown protein [Seminavis robusta]|eukprot:Sro210_g087520.1 n/a (371) ;mRNA; f:12665-13777
MDGSGLISRPATRRIRRISLCTKNTNTSSDEDEDTFMEYGSPVYVGADPVMKKSTRDLRNKKKKKKEEKVIPKRASKSCLQPRTRKSAVTKISISDTPKVPCRKPSNPSFGDSSVSHGDLNTSGSYVVMTRSRSRQTMDSHPREPSRKDSIPSNLQAAASVPGEAPCMPQRKASNPFFQGLSQQGRPMTRSLSKLQLSFSLSAPSPPTRKKSIPEFQMTQMAPSLPQRQASFLEGGLLDSCSGTGSDGPMTRSRSKLQMGHSHLGAPNVPTRKESIPEFQMMQPAMPPQRKASDPFMRGGLVTPSIQPNVAVAGPATQALRMYLQADTPPPQQQSNNSNNNDNKIQPSLGGLYNKTVSFRDLEWDKLSLL